MRTSSVTMVTVHIKDDETAVASEYLEDVNTKNAQRQDSNFTDEN